VHRPPESHPLRKTPPPPAVEPLYTIGQSAEALQCSEKTVRRLIERGELHVVRLGTAVRIAPAALRELIARGGEA
jgi:excisionase family DNA binding protein